MIAIHFRLLVPILMAMVYSVSWAAQPIDEPREKLIGKWDRNSGIISFSVKEVSGKTQARMIVAEERIEDRYSKLIINMQADTLDELDEFIKIAIEVMDDQKTEYTPSLTLASKESVYNIGKLIFSNSKLEMYVAKPENQDPYLSMRLYPTTLPNNQARLFVYWLNKDDLIFFRKLINKVLLAID